MRVPKLAVAAAGVCAALAMAGSASAQTQPLIGQLMLTAANFCPRGWLPTAGQTLPIAANQALFSLLGATYGGDGRTNFQLPKLAAPQASGLPPGTGLRWCISIGGAEPPHS
jgi:microcystin-dependent protein